MKFVLIGSNIVTADELKAGELAQIVEPVRYAGQTVMRYGVDIGPRGIVSLDDPRQFWDNPQFITVRPLAPGQTATLTQE